MHADIHPEYVVATVQLLVRQHLHHPLDEGDPARPSSAASATPSTPASRSWWTPAAASTASSAATASAARARRSRSRQRRASGLPVAADPARSSPARRQAARALVRRGVSATVTREPLPTSRVAPPLVDGLGTGVGAARRRRRWRRSGPALVWARPQRARRRAPAGRRRDAGRRWPAGRACFQPAPRRLGGRRHRRWRAAAPAPVRGRRRRAACSGARRAAASTPTSRSSSRTASCAARSWASRSPASSTARRAPVPRSTSRSWRSASGHADRELTAMVHGRPRRRRPARPGRGDRPRPPPGRRRAAPLNQLAPERWLRSTLIADPGRIGLARLARLAPAVPRPNLRDTAVAMARRRRRRGGERSWWPARSASTSTSCPRLPMPASTLAPDARLLLVVPERDAHPVTRRARGSPGPTRPRSSPSRTTGAADRGSGSPRGRR